MAEEVELDDDTVICQLGPKFWDRPRPHRDEQDVSVIVGPISVEKAVYRVNPRRDVGPEDALRETTVRKLRTAGFRVVGTPLPAFPEHASAYYEEGDWSDEVAETFAECFTNPEDGEDERDGLDNG